MSSRLMVGDDLANSSNGSIREAWTVAPPDVFNRSNRHTQEDDEYHLMWAAIDRLPTYERMRKGVVKHVLENGKVVHNEVDVAKLGLDDKKLLLESMIKIVEDDNEKFLRRLRDRQDRYLFYLHFSINLSSSKYLCHP